MKTQTHSDGPWCTGPVDCAGQSVRAIRDLFLKLLFLAVMAGAIGFGLLA